MTEGTIAARMLLRVVELCRARGHAVDSICRRAGIDQAALSDPDARVPYPVVAQLGEIVLEVTGDENFGLHLASDVQNTGNFDAGVLLLMASSSVRVALECMERYQRYWGDGDRVRIVPEKGAFAVRHQLAGATGHYARHAAECALAEIALGLRFLTGSSISARRVSFRHPAPSSIVEHEALFACPIQFGAAETEIVFDDTALDTPMEHANHAFFAIFEEQVERALARLPPESSASASVRAAAKAALASGNCTLAGAARALGMSTRNLQRKLQSEGTSFAEVVEALRRELAVAYLSRGIPIPEIALLLGYGDATAFHRAFRRWTGATPARFVSG